MKVGFPIVLHVDFPISDIKKIIAAFISSSLLRWIYTPIYFFSVEVFGRLMSNLQREKEAMKINIFEMTKEGIVPFPNNFLTNQIAPMVNHTDDKETMKNNILKRIKSYYWVVGIIMFRAIVDGISILEFVVPSFYRNGWSIFGLYFDVMTYRFIFPSMISFVN